MARLRSVVCSGAAHCLNVVASGPLGGGTASRARVMVVAAIGIQEYYCSKEAALLNEKSA